MSLQVPAAQGSPVDHLIQALQNQRNDALDAVANMFVEAQTARAQLFAAQAQLAEIQTELEQVRDELAASEKASTKAGRSAGAH